jgi:hypothetical protein
MTTASHAAGLNYGKPSGQCNMEKKGFERYALISSIDLDSFQMVTLLVTEGSYLVRG